MASEVLKRVRWRPLGWGAAAVLLILPFVAMQVTKEVAWTPSDFVAFAVMLLTVELPLELVARTSSSWNYRSAAVLALLGGFLTVWANLAVGIVGSEQNPANMLFFVALLVGIVGVVVVRGKAKGMALVMVTTAAALGVAFVIAVSGPTDEPFVPHGRELIGTGFFAALFLASAALFRKAANNA